MSDPLGGDRSAALASLLGCGPAAGPRALLGLGDGPVDPDTLEAALASRRRTIEAAGAPPELARRAVELLDAAAAALRASASEDGAAPVVRPPIRPSTRPAKIEPPSGPIAGRDRAIGVGSRPGRHGAPVRPKPKITAAHLTPFDRLVLAILVSGGGWNARTRVLVSGLAHRAGLDAPTLRRVVGGLAAFMREGGGTATFGEVARAPAARPAMPTPSRVESTMLRVAEGMGREFRGDSKASLYKLVTLFGLLAIFFGVVLITALTAPSPVVRDTNLRREEARAMIEQKAREDVETEAQHVVVPSTRPGVTPPAVFERAPMFRGRSVSEIVVLDIGRLPAAMEDLEGLARRLELNVDRLPDVAEVQWTDTVGLVARIWPKLEIDDRARVIERMLAALRFADDVEVADRLMKPLLVDPSAPIGDAMEPWTRAFRGGLLGAIVVDDRIPEPVREIARREVALHLPGSDGRHAMGGAFAALAGRTLDRMAPTLVNGAGVLDEGIWEDAWERWFEAQAALRRPEGVQRANLAVLTLVLEENRGLGGAGASSDLLGRLVRELDWTAIGPDPESLRDAYEAWWRSPDLDPRALWVLGSILEGPAGIGWYRPEFVPDPASTLAERRRVMTLALESWPASTGPVAKGELLPVDPALLDQIDRLLPEVRALVRSANEPQNRLEAMLAAERLALATTLLGADRIREAEAAIGLVIQQIDEGDSGVDLPDPLSPVTRSNDGAFAQSLKDAGRDLDRRLELFEALRQDALAGDLGPLDAAALVQEAWRGSSGRVRSAARMVLLDVFTGGPVVAVELLNTVGRASRTDDTVEFIEGVTGTTLPSRRDSDWESAVRRALAAHAIRLLDPEAEGIDRLVDAIRDVIVARAEARGAAVRGASPDNPAAAAAVAADAARQEAQSLFLAPGRDRSLADLDRRRAARRRLAPDEVRRTVAEHVAELEYLEFVLAARVPVRRSEFRLVLDDAADGRSREDSGLRQAARTALRLVELDRVRMVPRDADPLGGYG